MCWKTGGGFQTHGFHGQNRQFIPCVSVPSTSYTWGLTFFQGLRPQRSDHGDLSRIQRQQVIREALAAFPYGRSMCWCGGIWLYHVVPMVAYGGIWWHGTSESIYAYLIGENRFFNLFRSSQWWLVLHKSPLLMCLGWSKKKRVSL